MASPCGAPPPDRLRAAGLPRRSPWPARTADCCAARKALRSSRPRRWCATSDGRSRAVAGGPQVVVAPGPVVDPRALSPAPVVDGPLQQLQVGEPAVVLRPFAGHQPHTAPVRVDLAGTVAADPPAGPVAQLLGAGHGAGIPGDRQRALTAHAAAENLVLDRLLGCGEDPVPAPRSFQPSREAAVEGVGREQRLDTVQQPRGRAGPHRPRPRRDASRAASWAARHGPAAAARRPPGTLAHRHRVPPFAGPVLVICQRIENRPAVSPKLGGKLSKDSASFVRQNSVRRKIVPPNGSAEYRRDLVMFAPLEKRKPGTVATIPGWSGRVISSRPMSVRRSPDPAGRTLKSASTLPPKGPGPASDGPRALACGCRTDAAAVRLTYSRLFQCASGLAPAHRAPAQRCL